MLHFPLFALLVVAAPRPNLPVRPSQSESPVLAEATRILNAVKSTTYVHKAEVDEDAGIYNMDCSHFVGYVLARVGSDALKEIPKEPKHKYPRAFLFCDFFRDIPASSLYWGRVKTLAEAQPGDIIAWRMADLDPKKDTGHVAILKARPESIGGATYTISVIDASEVRHFSDSRTDGQTGIGTGMLQIHVDANGEPIEVKFNPKAKWHPHLFGIGRLIK